VFHSEEKGNGINIIQNEGFEESVFLGAQVAAKVIFVQDQGVSSGFLSRVQV
jgi:actin-related protein 9